MISVNFYLDKPGAEKSQVVCKFSFKGQTYRYFPGVSVPVKSWDKKKMKVKPNLDFHYEINDKLEELSRKILKIVISLQDPVTAKNMKFLIDTEVKGKESDSNSVREFFDEWIDRKKKLHDSYFERKWKTTINDALAISPLLTFNDIDGDFYNRYVEYLSNELKNVNNTIQGKVNRIKQLCREALNYGHSVNRNFGNFKFSGEELPPIFLKWEEVEKLMEAEPTFEMDCFLFRCYTGIRFSDMKYLTKDNIMETPTGREVRLSLKKQRKNNIIYLPPTAYQIWERNGFKLNPKQSAQENRAIKTIAEEAKLNRQVQIIRHRKSEVLMENKPLHKIISTHMARRTFARAWYDRGGDLNKLRNYLGHKKLDTTLKYVGLENKEANEEAFRLFG